MRVVTLSTEQHATLLKLVRHHAQMLRGTTGEKEGVELDKAVTSAEHTSYALTATHRQQAEDRVRRWQQTHNKVPAIFKAYYNQLEARLAIAQAAAQAMPSVITPPMVKKRVRNTGVRITFEENWTNGTTVVYEVISVEAIRGKDLPKEYMLGGPALYMKHDHQALRYRMNNKSIWRDLVKVGDRLTETQIKGIQATVKQCGERLYQVNKKARLAKMYYPKGLGKSILAPQPKTLEVRE